MSSNSNIAIENAVIMFKNFAGKAQKFNTEGDRNFCLVITPELAEQLTADGWSVRMTKPRDENDPPLPYVKVKVRFDNFPPNIYLHSGGKTVKMTEDMVGQLDYAEILMVDVEVSPYHWTYGGKTGTNGYLKTMHVTIREDPFAAKYAVPDEEGDLPW